MLVKYKFFQDPGHGWLRVSLTELQTLGIAGKISGYSYIKDGWVYLEEDCDCATFLSAKFGEGNIMKAWRSRVEKNFTNRESWVRYIDHYAA